MDAKRDVNVICIVAHRASRVDVKKLEKQEAKIKVRAAVPVRWNEGMEG